MKKIIYIKRIIDAYVFRKTSQLSFWHGEPEINEAAFTENPAEKPYYYMRFYNKANYRDITDDAGVPILDYHGSIGRQYNPIAISQYGLGNINLYLSTGEDQYFAKAVKTAEWFMNNIKENAFGVKVWMHDFDFDYAKTLKAPWYSGLAQGQILSFLIRVFLLTGENKYKDLSFTAFQPLNMMIEKGGCLSVDGGGNKWIEEYITDPPMHILNGFIWALWGVYDFHKLMDIDEAGRLYKNLLISLEKRISEFDCGYWSMYDLSHRGVLKNLASPFYHKLHLVQLDIMYRLSGMEIFKEYLNKWSSYQNSYMKRKIAFVNKAFFKLLKF